MAAARGARRGDCGTARGPVLSAGFDPGTAGVWTGALDSLAPSAAGALATELDELGYGMLWIAEGNGREALTHAALLLGASSRIRIGTGIASIYGRDAVAANAAARTLEAQHPGRFVLGLGVSHAPLVESMRGHTYGKPLTAMREYLDAVDAAPYYAGGGAEAEPAPPRVLAALGPRCSTSPATVPPVRSPTLLPPSTPGPRASGSDPTRCWRWSRP